MKSGRIYSGFFSAALGAAALGAAAFPLSVFAQVAGGQRTLTDFINIATNLVILATPFGLLLLFFFWSITQLIMTTGEAEKKKQAKQRIIWGIIALFVVLSIGGLVAVVQNTFFGDNSALQGGR